MISATRSGGMAHLSASQLSAVSRFFSSSVIREMASKGKSPLFARLLQESNFWRHIEGIHSVGNAFDAAFSLLRREGLRHEYIYKAALTHKYLLGVHNLRTASMLTEFRVAECKADLAILNGTATVYEVKSERDSLKRLERQVAAYADVFARVYVIASESHLDAVIATVPSDVGVMRLRNRYQITTMRVAADRPDRTSPSAIFDCIRTEEARLILVSHGIAVPKAPNTEMSFVLRGLFLKLDPCVAHAGMVKVLKKTRDLLPLADLIDQLPRSLHTAALSVPMRKSEHMHLLGAVNTSLVNAMAWA